MRRTYMDEIKTFYNNNNLSENEIETSINDFNEKVIQIKRVSKVVKGGKRVSFIAVVIVGNKINKVGLGVGKASETKIAIEKALVNAKQNMYAIKINKKYSLTSKIIKKYCSSKIELYPKRLFTCITASNPIHTMLEFAGYKNISAKEIKSKNILNNLKATIESLPKTVI